MLRKERVMLKVKQFVKQTMGERTAIARNQPQELLEMAWRERIGVEPTVDTAGCLPTDLKSAESTGAHPLP